MAEPRRKTFGSLGTFPVQNSVSLLAVKDQMMTAQETMYPITMEEAESGYGYMLYSVNLKIIITKISSKLWRPVTDCIFADGSLQTIQYQENLREEVMIKGTPEKEWIELDVLVENLGRVNYGFKLNGPTQVKGIRGESCKTSIFIKAIGNMH